MLRLLTILIISVLPWLSTTAYGNTSSSDDSLAPILEKLPKTKLKHMSALVEQIASTEPPQKADVLTYLLNNELYYLKSNKQIVRAVKNVDKTYQLTPILAEADPALAAVKKTKIKKVKTNNRIRGQIRGLLAQMDLTNPDKSIRMSAVETIINKPNSESIALLKTLQTNEKDEDVAELMSVAIYIEQLKTGTNEEKIAAVNVLKESLQPAAKNEMTKQLEALGEHTANHTLKNALTDAVDKITEKQEWFGLIENLFFGLSLGSVLLLAAIGLAITFGVMGVINMAHGEMIMLGAYTTYVIQLAFPQWINYSLFMAIPAAFLVSGFVGILIERGVIRFLKGRPLETLLATFGISLILQQLVRSVFSPLNRTVQSPEWMSGSWQINPIFSLTYNRLYIIIFSLIVFFALMMILKKSSLGLHVRAVAQNRNMARALSIKSDWVDAITFGLGSGIAGVAGVVLSQLTNVGPNLGQSYIIDSFLVVVFGGVGNLWGTLVAAMSLGSFNKFLEPITGSVLANIIVLVGLVLFIQKRPKGLFPQKGRAAE